MGKGNHSNGIFISAAIAAIAQATTYTEGTGASTFIAPVVQVWDVKKLVIQGFVTGEADANGEALFKLIGRVEHDGDWDTVAAFSLAIRMVSNAAIVESAQIDVQGYHSLKLLSVQNTDGAKDATLVNLKWGKAYGSGNW